MREKLIYALAILGTFVWRGALKRVVVQGG